MTLSMNDVRWRSATGGFRTYPLRWTAGDFGVGPLSAVPGHSRTGTKGQILTTKKGRR